MHHIVTSFKLSVEWILAPSVQEVILLLWVIPSSLYSFSYPLFEILLGQGSQYDVSESS